MKNKKSPLEKRLTENKPKQVSQDEHDIDLIAQTLLDNLMIEDYVEEASQLFRESKYALAVGMDENNKMHMIPFGLDESEIITLLEETIKMMKGNPDSPSNT